MILIYIASNLSSKAINRATSAAIGRADPVKPLAELNLCNHQHLTH